MPSWKRSVLTVVRVGLVIVGIGLAGITTGWLLTMPPPPPDSDGFAHGMAALVGSVIIVTSLGIATISVVLPTVLGRTDPLGFTRWQRHLLRAAGLLLGGGFVLGIAYGYVKMLPSGLLLWLGFVLLAAGIVCVTLAWRLAEVLYRFFARTTGGDPS